MDGSCSDRARFGHGGSILVFEDDDSLGQAFAAMLRKSGYQVQVANHFEPVLQTLESKVPIDLLVTDIVVPGGVNGLALARMARLRCPGIKVIYVTGHDIRGAQKEALGHVLRKPVSQERLLREVSCALGSA